MSQISFFSYPIESIRLKVSFILDKPHAPYVSKLRNKQKYRMSILQIKSEHLLDTVDMFKSIFCNIPHNT